MTNTGDRPPELVTLARLVKTRGLRGEVEAELFTDFPSRFENMRQVKALADAEPEMDLQIEEYWFHKNRLILKFAGYECPESTKKLLGKDLVIDESACVELPDDEFYYWQLQGCRVYTLEGTIVGEVTGVLKAGAAPLLVIAGEEAGEHLIPMAKSICVEIDVDRKFIRIDAPEGLLTT